MLVELVRTTTEDGLRLDGVLHTPSFSPAPSQERPECLVDAVICVHGVGSNFYGSTLFESLLRPLGALGVSVLRVNTRGHDTLSTMNFSGAPRRQGAALEIVDECRFDIAAWIRHLAERPKGSWARALGREIGSFRPCIVLLGHSLGAIKVLYAGAHGMGPEVVGIVAASPPRLSYTAFSSGPSARDFLEAMSTAEGHVRSGQPQALFEARVPFPLIVGAAAYVDKYGRADRYNFCRFLSQIMAPVLFSFGAIELEKGGVAFAGLPEEIRTQSAEAQANEVIRIPGADHFYTGVREVWASEIARWIATRFRASPGS